jgi:hypothetical protein
MLREGREIQLSWWPVPNASSKNWDGSQNFPGWKRSFILRDAGILNFLMVTDQWDARIH